MPVVYNSPHSGHYYDSDFLTQSALGLPEIRWSEDAHIDQVFGRMPLAGAYLFKAVYPRAYVDVNREAYELDPDMFDAPLPDYMNKRSARAAVGLGTIPALVTQTLRLYQDKLSVDEAVRRLDRVYFPYHQALGALLQQVSVSFGMALLVDCHSFPSCSVHGKQLAPGGGADIVLGDDHGRSCAPEVTEGAHRLFEAMGYQVCRNRPYAGGNNICRYGLAGRGHHALQIEIRRSIYMNERTLKPTEGMRRLQRDISRWAEGMHRLVAGMREKAPVVQGCVSVAAE